MPAFDAASDFETTAASSLSWSHTCTGADRALFVGVGGESFGPTISTATYNSVDRDAELWDATVATFYHHGAVYWKNPASGANTIVITYTGTFDRIVGTGCSLTGVHQTTAVGTAATNTGDSTAPTVDVTAATDDLVLDRVTHIGGGVVLTVGGGQTQRKNVGAVWKGGLSEEAGAATVTMSWSADISNQWMIGGVAFKPAAAGGLLFLKPQSRPFPYKPGSPPAGKF